MKYGGRLIEKGLVFVPMSRMAFLLKCSTLRRGGERGGGVGECHSSLPQYTNLDFPARKDNDVGLDLPLRIPPPPPQKKGTLKILIQGPVLQSRTKLTQD